MSYLDPYGAPLDAAMAAHLLRRATFGPTRQEITNFSGLTASQAVDKLIVNAKLRENPPPPVEMEAGRSDSGQTFLDKPFNGSRASVYSTYVQYWWIGLMAEQNGSPSVLEKLTAFWQNHFVTIQTAVEDYRFTDRYLRFLRANALGNFRTMAIGITKDPAMLIFQNGNENTKESPNENYARELQELFTVGQKDFNGNHNYTEQDVKAAARVLTGWQATNKWKVGTTSFETVFTPDRHDTGDKVFSSMYNNKVISGRSGSDAGDAELNELIAMLLNHQETAKFICRKLYRWYVNPNVTQEIEDNVIIPLANFFRSTSNDFAIMPVVRKLLSSEIFFDNRNVGAIVKSPAEFMIGMTRLFDQQVPDLTTEYTAYRSMIGFLSYSMKGMQLDFLDQPSVFGSLPYYLTGYSKNWINESTLGLRGARSDAFVYPYVEVKPGQLLQIDVLSRLKSIQPNFSDVAGTAGITCEMVLAEFSLNLFALNLSEAQNNFLIDNIMMMNSSPRTSWVREWNAYRAAPTDVSKQNVVLWRCRTLLKYMLRMAEFQLF